MLAVVSVAFFGMTYYFYSSRKFDDSNAMKILYVFLTVSLIYAIYIPVKKFFKNEPVLTLNVSEIKINEKGKPVSFIWPQVINWRIEKEEDGGTHYLTIETADNKRKINISWLDKRPREIEVLLQKLKSK